MASLIYRLYKKWKQSQLPPKIVGLLPARNESAKIEFALRSLALHTDAIVYLDDCSTDDTLDRVRSLQQECRIEKILTKDQWHRDEPTDRNRMLNEGRKIGGTHFIVIDADEALTSNLLENDLLRKRILSLGIGDQLALRWINLWRSIDCFRTDGDKGVTRFKYCIFRDDGAAYYSSDFIHTSRIPRVKGKRQQFAGEFGLMHFQYVYWPNFVLKLKWYRWLERVHHPSRSVDKILHRYTGTEDESGLQTQSSPAMWFTNYPFLQPEVFNVPDNWRLQQLEEWENELGAEPFAGLS